MCFAKVRELIIYVKLHSELIVKSESVKRQSLRRRSQLDVKVVSKRPKDSEESLEEKKTRRRRR